MIKKRKKFKEGEKNTHSSSWQYLGTVFIGVGLSLALSGSVAFYAFQQGNLMNVQYTPYFLPIMLAGVIVLALGAISFLRARQKSRSEVPPPPPIPPPPPPPPP
jgi:ABC-type multidrug transport system permease subunit